MKQIFAVIVVLALLLSGCGDSKPTAESLAQDFWKAVIEKDMETAKSLASWDTVDYLKYIRSGQLKPARFELGEAMQNDQRAVIDTTLYSASQGQTSVKIPGKTVLLNTEHGWRVDLKSTIGSTVQETVGTVFDQLNNIMQQGLEGLDAQLSESMKELGEALEKGAEELKNELSKPPFGQEFDQPAPPVDGQRI